ncbi:Rpn family recombination-promoting nuclease/putative transposase [Candidatus Babeliales bacterium]|nr:Rpn family recombination-promoting nuclease/putative transposase [Candidatus Babeliales bacterium]MBP9843831.1 Rpn family recombination-promoting nuclease/putative transposase [Candidatus Babeliales bacterium]
MNKFASPTKDSTFKLIFGEDRHKNLTIDFLNNFLDRKDGNLITNISFMKQEQTPRSHEERKSILDIHCKDQTGSQFIIEMQAGRENFFVNRALYYASCLLSRQLDREDVFIDLKPVIVIGILDYTLLDSHKEAVSHHLITDMNTGQQSTNLIELHFIELAKFNKTEDELESQTDKWMFFLKNAHKLLEVPDACKDSKIITKAFHIMECNNWTAEQIRQYEYEMLNFKRNLTQYRSVLQEGRLEVQEAIAIKLLKKGKSVAEISELTELSLEQIEALAKK